MLYHVLEVDSLQFNLFHMYFGCRYTPAGHHGMSKTSHCKYVYYFGGLIVDFNVSNSKIKHPQLENDKIKPLG